MLLYQSNVNQQWSSKEAFSRLNHRSCSWKTSSSSRHQALTIKKIFSELCGASFFYCPQDFVQLVYLVLLFCCVCLHPTLCLFSFFATSRLAYHRSVVHTKNGSMRHFFRGHTWCLMLQTLRWPVFIVGFTIRALKIMFSNHLFVSASYFMFLFTFEGGYARRFLRFTFFAP